MTRLDRRSRVAHLDTGERLGYDAALIATGRRSPAPRSLAPAGPVERILVLRTAADAAHWLALDRAGRRRGGAAGPRRHRRSRAARRRDRGPLASEGAVVTLIDPDPAPLDRLFGERWWADGCGPSNDPG